LAVRPPMVKTKAACPLCGELDYQVVYDLRAVHSDDDVPGLIVRCRSCPMWFKQLSNASGLPTRYPAEPPGCVPSASFAGSPSRGNRCPPG